jgi:hypothetical protein
MRCKVIACLLGTTMLFGSLSFSQQDVKNIIIAYKPALGLYGLDGYSARDILFLPGKEQLERIQFTAFAGREYRLIICGLGFSEPLSIEIFDKPLDSPNRHKVYSSVGKSDTCIFEPQRPGVFYIECHVPASGSQSTRHGKIVMLIGLKEELAAY